MDIGKKWLRNHPEEKLFKGNGFGPLKK